MKKFAPGLVAAASLISLAGCAGPGEALSRMGHDTASVNDPQLREMLDNLDRGNDDQRMTVMWSLSQGNHPAIARRVEKHIGDSNLAVSSGAAVLYAKNSKSQELNADVVEKAIAEFKKRPDKERRFIGGMFAQVKGEGPLKIVEMALADEKSAVRARTVEAMYANPNIAHAGVLGDFLKRPAEKDEDERAQLIAIDVLSGLRGGKAKAAMKNSLQSKRALVRIYAAYALARLSDKSGEKVLKAGLSDSDKFNKFVAAAGLEHMGRETPAVTRAELAKMAKSKNMTERRTAQQVLPYFKGKWAAKLMPR